MKKYLFKYSLEFLVIVMGISISFFIEKRNAKDYQEELKNQLGDQFRICGYYLDNELVGFNTIILQDDTLETYFLGYDEQIQREHMLYLNRKLINLKKHLYFGRVTFLSDGYKWKPARRED